MDVCDDVIDEVALRDSAIRASLCRGSELSDEQLDFCLRNAGVNENGKKLVRQARRSPPETAPRSNRERGNVEGRVPLGLSKKVIQFGSVFPELCFIYYVDSGLMSKQILEFINRISIRGVEIIGPDGRKQGVVAHRVHGVCVEADACYFAELRRESDLVNDNLYVQDEKGNWSSPTLEGAAACYGMGYRLYLDRHLGPHMLGNLSYVACCYYPDYESAPQEEEDAVVRDVQEARVINRSVLIEKGHSARAVKQVLARGRVYVNFSECDLTSTYATFLYASREDYVAHKLEREAQGAMTPLRLSVLPVEGQEFMWDSKPWTVVNAGFSSYVIRGEKGLLDISIIDARRLCDAKHWVYEAVEQPRLQKVSPRRRQEALDLLEMRNLPAEEWVWKHGAREGRRVSMRTIQRVQSTIKRAEAEGLSPLDALVRHYDNCGSSQPHVDNEYEVWEECLNDHYLTNVAPTVISVAAIYRNRCAARGITPVSAETIRRRVRKLDKAVIVREQDGKFQAYYHDSFVPQDKINRLIKGRIPYEVAHVDDTPASIKLICPVTGKVSTVSAWRSVMRDASHFKVLGHVVFYGSPSTENLFRLLIETVKRQNGRLPQYLVCDRHLVFKSKQWRRILGRYGIVVLYRPARRPRHGQPVESGNRKDDQETMRNLDGHAKPHVDFRNQIGEYSQENSAVITLSDLRRIYDEKYYEIELRNPSSRTGLETISAFESRVLSQVDDSHIRKIKYDEEFIQLCMPEVDGTYRVVNRQGSVYASGQEYFSEELLDPELIGKRVVVHYDPDNIGRVLVWKKAGWVECRSDKYEILSTFTEAERMDYQAYLRNSGDVKSIAKALKEEDLATSLQRFRDTAQGRLARVRALENMGAEIELSDEAKNAIEESYKKFRLSLEATLCDGEETGEEDNEQGTSPAEEVDEDDIEIPDYNAFSDRAHA